MSKRLDLEFREVSTWTRYFPCYDEVGNPLDLTGATVSWRLVDGETVALEKTTGSGLTIISSGVLLSLPADTSVEDDTYQHELRATLADGSVVPQYHGYCTVKASVFDSVDRLLSGALSAAASLSATLTVTGAALFTAAISGSGSVTGALSVSGSVSLTGSLSAHGTLGGTLTLPGSTAGQTVGPWLWLLRAA